MKKYLNSGVFLVPRQLTGVASGFISLDFHVCTSSHNTVCHGSRQQKKRSTCFIAFSECESDFRGKVTATVGKKRELSLHVARSFKIS